MNYSSYLVGDTYMSGLLSIEEDIVFSDEENEENLQCTKSIHSSLFAITKDHTNEDVLHEPDSHHTFQSSISNKMTFSFLDSTILDEHKNKNEKCSQTRTADMLGPSKKRKFEFRKLPKKASYSKTESEKCNNNTAKERSKTESIFDDLILDDADDDILSQIPNKFCNLPNTNILCQKENTRTNNRNENSSIKAKSVFDDLILDEADDDIFNQVPDVLQNPNLHSPNSNCSKSMKRSFPKQTSATKEKCSLTLRQNTKQTNLRKSKTNSNQQRKFPGPAGLLPKIKHIDDLDCLKSPEIAKQNKRCITPLTPKTPVCDIENLLHDDMNESQVWCDLLAYQKQYFPHLNKMAVSTILDKANSKDLLHAKVELFCALIRNLSIVGSGGRVALKDNSGEIVGTVTKNVLEEFEPFLKRGNGIILKDVSVFSPSPKKHYLNITPVNVVQVFAPSENELITTQALISDCDYM